jgi:hypothetical protein
MAHSKLLSSTIVRATNAFEQSCEDNTQAYAVLAAAKGASSTSSSDVPFANEPITVFHTREHISMPLGDLAVTMQRITRCEDEALVIALTLCIRYGRSSLPVTRQMMHRLFVAALHVGLKTHSDSYLTNTCYARAAGVSTREMNRLEAEFLKALDWNVTIFAGPANAATGEIDISAFLLGQVATIVRKPHSRSHARLRHYMPAESLLTAESLQPSTAPSLSFDTCYLALSADPSARMPASPRSPTAV